MESGVRKWMGIRTQLMSCIIFQKSVLTAGSLAWEFGQRHSASRLRRGRREVAFGFPQGDEGAGAAGDRALPASGSSLLTTCSPAQERAGSRNSVHTRILTPKDLGRKMVNVPYSKLWAAWKIGLWPACAEGMKTLSSRGWLWTIGQNCVYTFTLCNMSIYIYFM